MADHARLIEALDALAIDPWQGDIKKLGGEPNSWRRRVGNYRITYSINTAERAIVVEDIDRRTTTNYRHR